MTRLLQLPGGGPVGVHDLLGTEAANGEPSETITQRRSRCYELAGYALVFGKAPAQARLVHGSWQGPGAPQRVGHAWLEIPTTAHEGLLIWEPITAAMFAAAEFTAHVKAWDERTYDLHTAQRMIMRHQDFGRWHESRYP